MGKALELLGFNDTDAPAAFAAMGNNTNNSNTIRNASANSKIHLLTAFGNATGQAINVRVRSPLMHDNQQGLRFHIQVDNPDLLLDPKHPEQLYAQDGLIVENQQITADVGTNVHMFNLLVYYEDLPGVDANLVSPDFVMARQDHRMTTENTLATGTTGDWAGQEAINAEIDQFKANRNYALVGYSCSVACGAVRWQGIATGNLGVGGPGNAADTYFTMNFFTWLSERSGKPCIPVFNASDIAAVLIDASQDEGGADVLVISSFVNLKQ